MARHTARTPVLLFGFLAVYILLQSAWWMWLLVSKDRDVLALQQQLLSAGILPHLPVRMPKHTLWMVVGEGLVFLVLLLLALWITFRTLRQELSLARQQRDFLMAASHELRTPIAALKLHLQTLQRAGLPDDLRDELAGNARADVERLHGLAEQVLLASRLDEHAGTPQLAEVDAVQLLGKMIGEARATYARGHRLAVRMPEELHLRTDAHYLRTVATNLLENACKYSPQGSEVAFSMERVPQGVRVQVQDQGTGVAEEDLPRIFNKFYRGGNEGTRVAKGTGLGLFIVRRLMEDLGGRIEYRRSSSGGSTFTALFPDRT